jgi:hypothetical protein
MLYQLAERSAEFAFHKQNVKARKRNRIVWRRGGVHLRRAISPHLDGCCREMLMIRLEEESVPLDWL